MLNGQSLAGQAYFTVVSGPYFMYAKDNPYLCSLPAPNTDESVAIIAQFRCLEGCDSKNMELKDWTAECSTKACLIITFMMPWSRNQ
ncbi:uncharacterized [Tachysurus ichikawai]